MRLSKQIHRMKSVHQHRQRHQQICQPKIQNDRMAEKTPPARTGSKSRVLSIFRFFAEKGQNQANHGLKAPSLLTNRLFQKPACFSGRILAPKRYSITATPLSPELAMAGLCEKYRMRQKCIPYPNAKRPLPDSMSKPFNTAKRMSVGMGGTMIEFSQLENPKNSKPRLTRLT